MQGNPLQQFFRQPKIYIKLPSNGVYCKPGTVQGDISKLPIFSMTGMDEILVKTPDALLSGETTVKIIESCAPNIKDAWDISSIDMNMLMVAIRIASFGNEMSITHRCSACGKESDYDINLSRFIEHFNQCQYEPVVRLEGMTVNLKPLTYKTATEFALKGFKIKKQAGSILELPEADRDDSQLRQLYKELVVLQNEIFNASVESVELADTVVTDQQYIQEWLNNCDRDIYDMIKQQAENRMEKWALPPVDLSCDCGHKSNVFVDLDHSSFFARA
jgi:hypothetical protein